MHVLVHHTCNDSCTMQYTRCIYNVHVKQINSGFPSNLEYTKCVSQQIRSFPGKQAVSQKNRDFPANERFPRKTDISRQTSGHLILVDVFFSVKDLDEVCELREGEGVPLYRGVGVVSKD